MPGVFSLKPKPTHSFTLGRCFIWVPWVAESLRPSALSCLPFTTTCCSGTTLAFPGIYLATNLLLQMWRFYFLFRCGRCRAGLRGSDGSERLVVVSCWMNNVNLFLCALFWPFSIPLIPSSPHIKPLAHFFQRISIFFSHFLPSRWICQGNCGLPCPDVAGLTPGTVDSGARCCGDACTWANEANVVPPAKTNPEKVWVREGLLYRDLIFDVFCGYFFSLWYGPIRFFWCRPLMKHLTLKPIAHGWFKKMPGKYRSQPSNLEMHLCKQLRRFFPRVFQQSGGRCDISGRICPLPAPRF